MRISADWYECRSTAAQAVAAEAQARIARATDELAVRTKEITSSPLRILQRRRDLPKNSCARRPRSLAAAGGLRLVSVIDQVRRDSRVISEVYNNRAACP